MRKLGTKIPEYPPILSTPVPIQQCLYNIHVLRAARQRSTLDVLGRAASDQLTYTKQGPRQMIGHSCSLIFL